MHVIPVKIGIHGFDAPSGAMIVCKSMTKIVAALSTMTANIR